jgi:hypothetical protein
VVKVRGFIDRSFGEKRREKEKKGFSASSMKLRTARLQTVPCLSPPVPLLSPYSEDQPAINRTREAKMVDPYSDALCNGAYESGIL